MARHTSDLKQRELALRAVLFEGVAASTYCDPRDLSALPANEIAENYRQWRRKACAVLEATRRRGN